MTEVLVVDDDSLLRSMLVELLQAEGHDVRSVESGEEALDNLSSEQHEVAIVDLRLPGIGGLDVIRQGHEASPDTRMIAISGFANPDVAADAVRAGAVEFLSKPFDLERLLRTVHGSGVDSIVETSIPDGSLGSRGEDLLTRRLEGKEVLHVTLSEKAHPFGDTVSESRLHSLSAGVREGEEAQPPDLPSLTAEISSFAKEHPGSVVVVDNFEQFVSLCSWEKMEQWLAQVSRAVRPYGSWAGVIIDQEVADEGLVAEMERGASDAKTTRILESLNHPVRRQIIRFLRLRRWATFSAILGQGFTDSSSKLSFHLQKLLQLGTLAKDREGMYSLSEAGQQAQTVLRWIQEPEIIEIDAKQTILVDAMAAQDLEGGL